MATKTQMKKQKKGQSKQRKPTAKKMSKTVSYKSRQTAKPIKGTVLATVAPNASLHGVIGKLPKKHQEGCKRDNLQLYTDRTSFERYIVHLSTESGSQRRYVVASRAKLTV